MNDNEEPLHHVHCRNEPTLGHAQGCGCPQCVGKCPCPCHLAPADGEDL